MLKFKQNISGPSYYIGVYPDFEGLIQTTASYDSVYMVKENYEGLHGILKLTKLEDDTIEISIEE